LLGPFAARALADDPRAYAEACASCGARSRCPGVDAEYLRRFEGDELSAHEAIAPDDRDDRDDRVGHLARMFVGAGELAQPTTSDVARPRARLPMLGKVKPARPAREEAPRRAELRTGDALRAILPGLFDDE
jgi:hypothetical protein